MVQLLRPLEPVREASALIDAERAAAAVAPLLPASIAPLFDARFVRSHVLYDEYVYRLALGVAAAAGLASALAGWGSAADVVTRAGLDARAGAVPVEWLLRHLARRGALAHEDGRFRAERGLPAADPAPVLAEQRTHDPAALAAYTVAETVAGDYPAFLRGERAGEEILFAPARLALWTGYFSNDNVLYAVNNRIGAAAVDAWLGPGPHRVLELGGGLGSGAAALIERLRASGRLDAIAAYRFTELVPAFLRRAQRTVGAAPYLSFDALDMNRPFDQQGVPPGSASVVYAVNTLHVAADLAFTLAEIRRALAPGGQVIVSECVRPAPGHTLYPEFIFNLMETFRARGFLTIEQWTAALAAAGFDGIRVLPDLARIREVVPDFYVAAIGATRRS